MKKNNKKKICFIICFIICLVFISTPYVNADSDNFSGLVNGMQGIKDTPSGGESLKKVMKIIINLIRIAGGGIAIIMVTLTGIKYMCSSPEDKAEYKKKLMPIAIGVILLVSATELITKIGDVALQL